MKFFKLPSARLDSNLRFILAGATKSLDTVADYQKLTKALSESMFIKEDIKPILKTVQSSWGTTLTDEYFSHWCFNNLANRQVAKAKSKKNHYRLIDEHLEAFGTSVQDAIDNNKLFVMDLSGQ